MEHLARTCVRNRSAMRTPSSSPRVNVCFGIKFERNIEEEKMGGHFINISIVCIVPFDIRSRVELVRGCNLWLAFVRKIFGRNSSSRMSVKVSSGSKRIA